MGSYLSSILGEEVIFVADKVLGIILTGDLGSGLNLINSYIN